MSSSERSVFPSVATLFLRPSSHRATPYAAATRRLPHVKRESVVVMAAAWGANSQHRGRSCSFSKYCYRRAMGGGRRRGRDSFKCFFPFRNTNLNFELCFPPYIYIYIYIELKPQGRLNLTYILYKYPVRTAQ